MSSLGLVIAIVVSAMALSPLPCQDGVEFPRRGRGFGACFLFLLGFGIEAREQIPYDEVGY
jgi:hypothetical protein